jgi:hypothetical protein
MSVSYAHIEVAEFMAACLSLGAALGICYAMIRMLRHG